ncbi:MAG TPA: hypothetical protein VF624_01455 [Tepidisphaeraceae bacterium]|jgi:MYXO-CTERM domain-containing protein
MNVFSTSILASTLLATAASAAVTVQLSLVVDTASRTYNAFATVTDTANETLGLHGLQFDITGSNGVNVATSGVVLPAPTETTDFATFYQKGFKVFRSNGDLGQDITGYQELVNQLSPTGTGNNNILEGVGETAFTETNGAIIATNVAYPVRIAAGTYTGDVGLLTISGSTDLTTLLPANLPAATSGGAAFNTFSPSAVLGQAVSVPEPAGLAVVGLCGLIAARRRRSN